jgi:Phage ABA sandwich domain
VSAATELEAGRKLDVLVAEKVMGLSTRQITCIDHRGVVKDVGTVDPPQPIGDGRMGIQAHRLPDYSTDLCAAWAVLDKVSGDWQIWGGGVVAVVRLDDAHECRGVEVRADTLPLAICRAALMAVA